MMANVISEVPTQSPGTPLQFKAPEAKLLKAATALAFTILVDLTKTR